ncbi:hypothetical protein EJ02DRAFT_509680 [Clathrospora elynae]|uniref:Uncharacterized protein n=1 Tax=Clathrospora elynae TaxID=706981 RepID=A0A6A5T8D1_9PLEO|nr:hypothetical protein EJ02DRAFT_509680 [Clathrospora elynae]
MARANGYDVSVFGDQGVAQAPAITELIDYAVSDLLLLGGFNRIPIWWDSGLFGTWLWKDRKNLGKTAAYRWHRANVPALVELRRGDLGHSRSTRSPRMKGVVAHLWGKQVWPLRGLLHLSLSPRKYHSLTTTPHPAKMRLWWEMGGGERTQDYLSGITENDATLPWPSTTKALVHAGPKRKRVDSNANPAQVQETSSYNASLQVKAREREGLRSKAQKLESELTEQSKRYDVATAQLQQAEAKLLFAGAQNEKFETERSTC